MRTQTVKFIAVLLLTGIALSASADFEKKIHKSWGINSVQAFSIDNKFGDINFISNRDDSVTIDVAISIDKYTDKKAEYYADQIEFRFYLKDGVLHAKTDFTDDFKINTDFSITYTVNIPTNRDLKVENKYGNVKLGNLDANGDFEIQYGNIQGMNLIAPGDQMIQLELKYGNANFDNINRLNAEVGYSKLSTGDIDKAEMETKYSVLKIGEVGSMIAESKYDDFTLSSVDKLEVESKFTQWDIDVLTGSFAIENEFGGITVRDVQPSFQTIDIENSYGSIRLGVDDAASYQLKSECNYCKTKHPEANVIKHIEDGNREYVEAVVGNSSNSSKIIIESKYGNVTLKK